MLWAARAQAQPAPGQIDVLVKEAMAHWNVPGAAVAIVHEDRVVYLKGFGLKELGKAGAVTPDTVFPLASCSKALTVTALAMLVDEGKLDWDDPVRKHLPWFQLMDPCADANVTLRDLLTHRTGLGKHEPLWYRSPLSVEERARRLALLEPSHSFRAVLDYQVVAFGAAGLAGGQAARTSWQELMHDRLLRPLDMKSASAVFPGLTKADCAAPHKQTAKGIVAIERYPLDEPDPAGSIHASARDLSKFLRLQLSGGVVQGRRLVSEQNLYETHAPQIVLRHTPFTRAMNPHTHAMSYGLGWIAQDYRGRWLLMHPGAVDGFRAQLTLVPELRLGIALVNNLDRSWMNFALSNTLVDRFGQLPAKDWNTYIQAVYDEDARQKKARLQVTLAARKPNTRPSLPLSGYAGTYDDPAYGVCRIRVEKDQLVWEFGSLRSRLEHFHFDTFITLDEPMEMMALTFRIGATGELESVRAMDRTFRRK
jgi:CubicO group peptidase (beta-lactamase class C family)